MGYMPATATAATTATTATAATAATATPTPLQAPYPPDTTMGGMPPPSFSNTIVFGEGVVRGASVPGAGPIITVPTDDASMIQDGILPPQSGRSIRRNPYHYGGGAGGMNPMGPMMNRYTPTEGGQGNSTSIVVTKLE